MANPNPSPDTRFGGKNGNTPNGGKTSAQKNAEYAAAEKAALIGDLMVSSIMEKLEGGQDAVEFIDPATLKLLKDVQDRAHGTPTQAVEHSSPDGSMSPRKELSAEELEQEMAKRGIPAQNL